MVKVGMMKVGMMKVGVDYDDEKRLCDATQQGQLKVVKRLVIEKNVCVHAYCDQPLRHAAKRGFLEIVKFLVVEGDADVHAKCDEALFLASRHGHFDVVCFLMEHGADVSQKEHRAFRIAAEKGNLQLVKLFLEHRCSNVHAKGDDALIMAAFHGHSDIVQCLIEHGANVKCVDLYTPVCHGHYDVVAKLLAHGCKTGKSYLGAVWHKHLDILNLLIDNGSDITSDDNRALQLSLRKPDYDIMHCLITHGAHLPLHSIRNPAQKYIVFANSIDEERQLINWFMSSPKHHQLISKEDLYFFACINNLITICCKMLLSSPFLIGSSIQH